MMEDEPTIDQLTCEAMLAGRDAILQRISDFGYDPAYWDVRITLWQVDANLSTRLHRFEYEGELKDKDKEE